MLSEQARHFLDTAFALALHEEWMGGPTEAERQRIEAIRAELASLQQPAMPHEVVEAIRELRDLADEAIPYAGEYFDNKWQLTERFNQSYPLVDAWLENLAKRDKTPEEIVGNAQPAMPVALDMPDGPGWWVHDNNGRDRFVAHFPKLELLPDKLRYRWGDDDPTVFVESRSRFGSVYQGKWVRLTMPWEMTKGADNV